MRTATRTSRPHRFAVRGPLGPWAVWVREQREDHGWTEADLAAVLWGESSADQSGTQVRRWEAGHWEPTDDACARLVAAFGSSPTGIEAPATVHPSAADEWLPTRVAIADAITATRADLRFDLHPTTDEAVFDAVDLSDLDTELVTAREASTAGDADEDGW